MFGYYLSDILMPHVSNMAVFCVVRTLRALASQSALIQLNRLQRQERESDFEPSVNLLRLIITHRDCAGHLRLRYLRRFTI